MQKIGKHILLSLAISCFAQLAPCLARSADAPQVKVSVSPNPASADDSVLLRIEVEGSSGRVGRPSFKAPDFDVVGQSSSLQSTSHFVNGQFVMTGKHQFSFVLFPKKSGTLTISQIQVPIDSSSLNADDLIVQVRPGQGGGRNSQAPSKNWAPDQEPSEDDSAGLSPPPAANSVGNPLQEPSQLNSDFTVFLALDKKTAYVGEPIIAEYWIYDFSNLVQMEVNRWPSFNGFWKEDLEIVTRTQFESAYVGMKRVRRALLGRFALSGIKPGKISLEKLVVDGVYLSRTRNQNDDDPFMIPFFGTREQRKASHGSQETVLEILPLPEQGRPSNFGGAVGNFSITLSADKTSIDVNTPLNVQVNYEGVGNFPAIEEPKLALPSDFEIFESNVSFKDSVAHGARRPIANKKTFNFVLIPRKPGSYTIPALSFSFFDPKKRAYQTVNSAELRVQVTGTVSAQAQPTITSTTPTGPKAPGSELMPLRPVDSLSQENGLAKAIWALVAFLSLTSLVLLGIILRKAKWPKWERDSDHKKINAKRVIKELEKQKTNDAFLAKLEEALYDAASAAIKKPAKGMLREELEAEWRELKLSPELFHKYYALIDRCGALRYGKSIDKPHPRAEILADLENFLLGIAKA